MSAPALTPIAGRLVPLRTKDEVRASLETHSAYVIEVPAKLANTVKDAVQAATPDFKSVEISHLRRVVQFKYLPAHLQEKFQPPTRLPRVRFFLLCPTKHISRDNLVSILRTCPPFDPKHPSVAPRLFTVTVPVLAPISGEQAAQWSEQYWPISYKNTNPYGPHPSLVQRNTAEIESGVGNWLALARAAGTQISNSCLGEKNGVVVVDPANGVPQVIAVAGDCRWRAPNGAVEEHTGTGNVMAHAVQRAIAMVAKKRLRIGGTDPALLDRSLFCDSPLTPVEKEYYDKDNIAASGYLCVDLDIYLTNEPCVMCSMAILHSRFRRCIFENRMPRTGAMASDSGLRHGLFWRPSELNWKFLAWEFKEDNKDANAVKDNIDDTMHV